MIRRSPSGCGAMAGSSGSPDVAAEDNQHLPAAEPAALADKKLDQGLRLVGTQAKVWLRAIQAAPSRHAALRHDWHRVAGGGGTATRGRPEPCRPGVTL